MPRGTQFGELVTMFREEAGEAVSQRFGQNALPSTKAVLRRTYRRLHADFNWPHLRIQRDEALYAGQQYYTLPIDLDQTNVWDVWVRQVGNTVWYDMTYGIGIPHYNTVPSSQGERQDFPYAWQYYEDGQFEVWPIPKSDGHTLRFYGKKRAKKLVNDSDIVDLDDDLIVLYAAAEQLARDGAADAELKLQQARQHYMRLRANSQKDEGFDMKVSQDRRPNRRGIDIRFAELRDKGLS